MKALIAEVIEETVGAKLKELAKSVESLSSRHAIDRMEQVVMCMENVETKLTAMDSTLQKHVEQQNALRGRVESLTTKLATLESTVALLTTKADLRSQAESDAAREIKEVRKTVAVMQSSPETVVVDECIERARRDCNALVHGLPEEQGEHILTRCRAILSTPTGIESAERLGKASEKARPVLVRFSSRQSKHKVFKEKRSLMHEGKKLYVHHDLTRQQQQRRRELVETYKVLRTMGVRCTLPRDSILDEEGAPMPEGTIQRLLQESSPQVADGTA